MYPSEVYKFLYSTVSIPSVWIRACHLCLCTNHFAHGLLFSNFLPGNTAGSWEWPNDRSIFLTESFDRLYQVPKLNINVHKFRDRILTLSTATRNDQEYSTSGRTTRVQPIAVQKRFLNKDSRRATAWLSFFKCFALYQEDEHIQRTDVSS